MRWHRTHIEIESTILTVLSGKDSGACSDRVIQIRSELNAYAAADPEFLTDHRPRQPLPGAPDTVRRMCRQSARAGVGPMAAVAGLIAEESLLVLLKAGSREAVVDNGGDIALKVEEPVLVGLYCGGNFCTKLALKVEPRDTILSICTSSGTVGHSHSYGRGDAAVVISRDAVLADAAATALGNRIRNTADLNSCFEFLSDIPEIEGALAVCSGSLGLWGDIPEIVDANVDADLITRGRSNYRDENYYKLK